MQKSGDLTRLYTPVNVLGSFPYAYQATIWIRKDSNKIGIRQKPDEIEIPAYLLTSNRPPVAQFNAEGALVVPLSSKDPFGIDLPAASPGNWVCEIVSRNASAADCKVMNAGPTMRVRLTTASSGTIEIEKAILKKLP